jgi:hypothetical protein
MPDLRPGHYGSHWCKGPNRKYRRSWSYRLYRFYRLNRIYRKYRLHRFYRTYRA